MKKTVLLFLTLLVSDVMISQIKTIKSPESVLIGKAQDVTCTKYDGNSYVFTYRDFNYKYAKEYKSFGLNEKDFNDLYDVIAQGYIDVPKEAIVVETPSDILYLKYMKYGGIQLQITQDVDKSGMTGKTKYLTKNMAAKLFGKKKKR